MKELIHLISNIFCKFKLTSFTVNSLGVSDRFIKQGTPVRVVNLIKYFSSLNSVSDTDFRLLWKEF